MSKTTKLANQARELFAAHRRLKKQFQNNFIIDWDEENDKNKDHVERK